MRRKRDGNEMNGEDEEWRERIMEKKRNEVREFRNGKVVERKRNGVEEN